MCRLTLKNVLSYSLRNNQIDDVSQLAAAVAANRTLKALKLAAFWWVFFKKKGCEI
jgi:glucuronate isomerase